MANLLGIHLVGASLVATLRNRFPEPLRSEHPCQFQLISSGELADPGDLGTAVTVYLYRITVDPHQRRTPLTLAARDAEGPLIVDLHYLVSVWSESALAEQAIAAWVMTQFHQFPVLDRSSPSADGGWEAEEQVQIVPEELSNEDLMRIWDALAPSYRLSLSYTARVVRIVP